MGQTISSFHVTRKLGEGGFGAVYLGQHPEIESKVAIKVLREQFVTDSSMVERFMDEARAVNRIGHRGIVRIHDTGRLPEVGAYLVMEYLEGESLLDRFRRKGPLPADEAVRFIMQACTALGACHRAGIVHRDLKPANMFIVADEDLPGGERVIILDFGIAKLVQQQDLGRATATGTLLGSPLYMSPEQCIDSKNVDHRSDIFSLGVVAYELLAGQCPYEADTLGQLVIKHDSEEPPPLRELRSDLPLPLEQAVARALERQPEDRYQNMEELRRALEVASSDLSSQTPGAPLDLEAIGEAETIAPDSGEREAEDSIEDSDEDSIEDSAEDSIEDSAEDSVEDSGDEPALASTASEVRAVSGGRNAGLVVSIVAVVLLGGAGLYVALLSEPMQSTTDPGAGTPPAAAPPVTFTPPATTTPPPAAAPPAAAPPAADAAPRQPDMARAPDGGHPSATRGKPKVKGKRRPAKGKRPPRQPTKDQPRKKTLYFKKL